MVRTDVAVRSARPRGKDHILAESAGHDLPVTPAGGTLWRLKSRVRGVETKPAPGPYPEMPLSRVRKARDADAILLVPHLSRRALDDCKPLV